MTSEVKPCPFCGTSMVVVTKDMFSHPGTLGDSQCLLAGKSYYWEHIDWWNTRADRNAVIRECVDLVKSCEEPQASTFYGDVLGWSPKQHLDGRLGCIEDAILALIEEDE